MNRFANFAVIGALVIGFGTTSSHALTVTIGDNDGYGAGISDNGNTAAFAIPGTDNRSVAEAAAADGSQFTDVYSALFPGFGPNGTETGSFIFNLPSAISSGTLTIDMADFQSSAFGPVLADINGVPFSLFFDDGFQNSVVRSFILSAVELAAINGDGFLSLNIQHQGSNDFIAFDYLSLEATPSAIPIPAALPLLVSAVVGLGFIGHRRKRKTLSTT
jgi:hypothetical protein